jgi:hypothetical protein
MVGQEIAFRNNHQSSADTLDVGRQNLDAYGSLETAHKGRFR